MGISSTLLTNTTSPPYSTTTSPTYPLHNTTTNSSTQHSTHSKPADVTTKVIVTETADGVPTETRVAPSRTGTATECAEAGPSCTVLASSAHTSEKASLLGVLGPLAVVGGFCDFALRVYLDGMVYFARLHNARKYGYASALFCVFGCCDFWLLAIGSQG